MIHRLDKILWVILMGSIWGSIELFGADLFRALHIPNKSALLFALAIMVMIMSKRVVDFSGSVILMAVIAGAFKTASSNFYICQVAAVLIDGAVFEGMYRAFKDRLETNMASRSIAAPIIGYLSFTLFAVTATYLIKDPNWGRQGFAGIGEYLRTSALYGSILSIFTINLGYYLGRSMQRSLARREVAATIVYRFVSPAIAAAIWVTGQLY